MAGNRSGGLKARDTNYKRHGKDFYKNICRKASHPGTGGFASKKVGKDGLTGLERARKYAGRKLGAKNKGGKNDR